MPTFRFKCRSCCQERLEFVTDRDERVTCECGAAMARLFTPGTCLTSQAARMAIHQTGSHAEWLERNQQEIDRKLSTGELERVNKRSSTYEEILGST